MNERTAAPAVVGLHHLRVPVSDVMCGRDWYSTVFDFESWLTFEEEDRVVGVVVIHESGVTVGLHHAPELARSLEGFCLIALSVGDSMDLSRWCTRLDTMGTNHTSPAQGHLGWHVEVSDPDGLVVQLHTIGQPTANEA
jgi:hypothetical protein